MSYVQKFDDTFWNCVSTGSWTGTVWHDTALATNDTLDLQAIGGWNAGYTPANLRLTMSASGTTDINVYLNSGGSEQHIGVVSVTTTPTAFVFALPSFPLDRPPGDIVYLSAVQDAATLTGPWTLTFQNIEFDEVTPAAFWTNLVKSTETDA